jgi:hypothetical protein
VFLKLNKINMREFVIIRTAVAGVHMGYMVSKKSDIEGGYHVTLEDSRRIWSWAGANSLSELAYHGSQNPDACCFTLPVPKIDLFAIEIIYPTIVGKTELEKISPWQFKKTK